MMKLSHTIVRLLAALGTIFVLIVLTATLLIATSMIRSERKLIALAPTPLLLPPSTLVPTRSFIQPTSVAFQSELSSNSYQSTHNESTFRQDVSSPYTYGYAYDLSSQNISSAHTESDQSDNHSNFSEIGNSNTTNNRSTNLLSEFDGISVNSIPLPAWENTALTRYTDADYGWSVNYPASWQVRIPFENVGAEEHVIQRRVLFQTSFGELVAIDVWNTSRENDVVSWFNNNHAQFLSSSASLQTATVSNGKVAGADAILVSDPDVSEGGIAHQAVVFTTGGLAYRIEYAALTGGSSQQEFRQLLESFRLTDNVNQAEISIQSLPFLPIIFNAQVLACGGFVDPTNNPFPCCINGGNCTWWARFKRPDFGWDMLRNARYWYEDAVQKGYPVGQTPRVGAIAVWYYTGEFGHVAYVEVAHNSNLFDISEMNCDEVPPLVYGGMQYKTVTKEYLAPFLGFIYKKGEPGDNAPPLAISDFVETKEGEAVTINVLLNDSDPEGSSLSVTGVTNGSGGTVILNPDYTVTYIHNPGFYGLDTFTYTVSDGELSSTGTVTVNVVPIALVITPGDGSCPFPADHKCPEGGTPTSEPTMTSTPEPTLIPTEPVVLPTKSSVLEPTLTETPTPTSTSTPIGIEVTEETRS